MAEPILERITRLPFAVSNHPLIEAKLEFLQERGADPFTEYPLAEAILKLRQGVGPHPK
ncbi:MAG: hypothetical protein M3O72_01585 [Verrucomicrobiota bacterium]|nr:hypothetical protein [Verrucomicrobiota bacterium]